MADESQDLTDEIKLGVDASGVETGVGRAKRSIEDLGSAVENVGKRGGEGLNRMGRDGADAGQKLDQVTRNMVNSLQRQIAATEAGGTATRQYQESIARLRGANMDVLRPYLEQLDAARDKTEEAKRSTDGLLSTMRGVGNVVGGLVGGLAAAFSLRTFIDETVAAEQEQAQLAAVLRSTGEAAGWSREQLNAMAAELEGSSIFSAGDINQAQTRLLSYTNIVGREFPRAMQAVIDMSARMGMDVKSSAETIGRALDVPSEGLTALTRQGFRFTESQKDLVKQLEETGRTAEAQGIILSALESSYGGAANAARDTLGGSLSALKNAINDLMTGGDGSISALRAGVDTLTASVNDANTILGAMGGSADDLAGQFRLATAAQEGFAVVLETIAALGVNVGYVLTGVGREIGGMAAQAAQLLQFNFSGAAAIRSEMVADAAAARREVDATTDRILNARKRLREQPSPSAPSDVGGGAQGGNRGGNGLSKEALAAARKEAAEQAKIMAELSGLTASFEADWDRLNRMYAAGTLSLEQLTAAQATLLEKQPAIKAAIAEEAKAREAALKNAQQLADARNRESDGIEAWLRAQQAAAQQSLQSVQTRVQGLRDEQQALAIAEGLNISLAEAVERLALARLQEKQAGFYEGSEGWEAIQKEIEARKELLSLVQGREAADAQRQANQQMQQDWQRTVDQYGDVFRQGFADMLNNGKDGWKSFTRSLVTTFKTTVADQIYKMFAQPFVVNIVGNLLGVTGGGAGGAAMQMASGGSSGIMGLVGNAGGSLLSSLTGGSITGIGSAASLWGGLNGTILPAGMMGPSVAAPTLMSGAGNMLAAIPGWGWALAGVGALLGSVLGRKVEKRGYGLMGTLGEEDGVHDLDLMRKGGSLLGGPKWFVRDTGVSEMDKALQETYKQQRDALIDMGKALGLATDGVENFTVQLGSDELGDKKVRGIRLDGLSDEEAQKKIAEALATANNEIAQQIIGTWERTVREVERIDISRPTDVGDTTDYGVPNVIRESIVDERYIPSEFARDGEQAIDTLTRLATSITGVNAIFDTLGLSVYEASLSAADAASSFVDLFGGLENLNAAAQTYYQNFYSEDERRAKAREGMDKVFDDLGIERIDYDDPEARKKYREIVEREQARMVQEQQNREALRANFTGLILPEGGMPDAGSIGDIVRDFLGDTVGEMTDGAMDQLNGLISDFDTGALSLEGFTGSVMELIGASDDAGLSAEETVAALLNASGAFAAVTQSSDDAAESARRLAEEEERKAEEARRKAEEAVDLAFRNLQAATDRQLKSIDKQREALSAQRDSYAESLSLITGIFDIVRSNARELYGEVADTASMQAAQGMEFVRNALTVAQRTGVLPESEALTQAIQAARGGLGENNFATQNEADFARLVLAGQLSALEAISGKQKTFEEQQIERLDGQLKGLDKQSKQLQEQLDYWREQIDISRGAYDATMSIDTAVRGIAALLGAKTPGDTGGGSSGKQPVFGGGGGARPSEQEPARYHRMRSGGTAGVFYEGIWDESLIERLDKLSPVYHAFDGTGDLVGLAEAFKAAGGTIADLSILSGNWESDWRKAFASVGIPAFAGGGIHAGGLRVVGERGWELEATGPARIWNQQQLGQALGGGSDAMVVELRALREENQRQAGEIVRLNLRVAKVLERWDGDGMPNARVEAAV